MSMRSWIRSLFTPPATRPIRKASRRYRLGVEALEDRWLPSTFTVLNGLDDGPGSLRAAIAAANDETNNPGPDTINFDSGVTAVTLTTGQLTIASSISITGPAVKVTIARDAAAPKFRILEVSAGISAELSGLTITGGKANRGGGVFNNGTATLNDCTVSGNSASGDGGGGVFNYLGTATLTNCTVTGNSAIHGDGGGVYSVFGMATLTNCTVSGNTSFYGGGVFTWFGTATLTNCTVSGNSATSDGGGVYNRAGTATLTNCTVSGNSASAGGGLYNYDGGTATLTNCTVSGNSALRGGGVFNRGTATLTNCTVSGNSASAGGGLYNRDDSTIIIGNSIVAANTASGSEPDASGTVTSLGNNLIGNTDGSTGWVASDLTDASASPLNLGPLADNGGPTQTMALLPGSRAINAGSNALAVDANGVALAYDQRGPGYPRIHGDTVDIGAFEVNIASQTITFGPLADQTYGVAPITLSATASSGLPVSYQVISGPATLSGNVLTITGAGTVVVQATQAGDASYASADPVTQSFTVAKATLTGDATTQDALNMAKLGKLTITVSNVSGLVNDDTLATFLNTASYYITIGTTRYEFAPTTVTTSGSSITITYSLKDPTLLAELGHALDAATSGATAVTAGFDMESANYTLLDSYLTRLFSTVK